MSIYERMQDEEYNKMKELKNEASGTFKESEARIRRLYRIQMLREYNKSDVQLERNHRSFDKSQTSFHTDARKPAINDKDLFKGYDRADRLAEIQ